MERDKLIETLTALLRHELVCLADDDLQTFLATIADYSVEDLRAAIDYLQELIRERDRALAKVNEKLVKKLI